MRITLTTTTIAFLAFSLGDSVRTLASPISKRALLSSAPDVYDIDVKDLYPEDTVFDLSRNKFYQSNLWKGRVSVWDPTTSSNFNVLIPGVSSSGDGVQQLAGLSLNQANDKLFAVAKDHAAFRFGAGQQSTDGTNSFHRFDLPLTSSTTPVWSTDLNSVQDEFLSQNGIRPFGPVDSTQDDQDNSYVAFALGAPAIAKVSPDGKQLSRVVYMPSNGSQRPGFTGLQFIPNTKTVVAYGGPQALTAFEIPAAGSNTLVTPRTVQLSGDDFGSLDGTEKLTLVQSNGESILYGTKAPDVFSFRSTDGWKSATVKKFTRTEFQSNSLTVVVQTNFAGETQLYGGGAYFGEGAKGGRTTFPLYRIPFP